MATISKATIDQTAIKASDAPTGANAAPMIAIIALMACLSVASALVALVGQWVTVSDYDYCFVIALICGVWLWRSARELPLEQLRADRRLLVALALVSGAQYILWQGHSELGAQLLLPPVLWLAVASVVGWSPAISLLAPIGYFYFAIPLWDQLLPILQQVTLFGAKLGMQLAGVPVTVSGNKVSIAEGSFEVIYECSGLRYLVVALALGSLMAVLERMPLRRLLYFLILAAVLAVVANWLRVFIVMYAGHVTGMRHYFVTDNHEGVGHAVFAGLLLVIYWLAGRFATHGGSAAAPKPAEFQAPPSPVKSLRAQMVVVTLLLITFAGLNARAGWTVPNATTPELHPLPVAVGQWQGPLLGKSRWQPAFSGATDMRQVTYSSDDGQVNVYLNVYGQQQRGNELIFYRNSVYSPGNWQLVEAGIGNALTASVGRKLLITERLTDEGERWLIGRLYVVGGHRTATGLFAQVLYGLSTAIKPVPAGVLALAVRCSNDCVKAHDLLDEFWSQMGDSLIATIPQTLPAS